MRTGNNLAIVAVLIPLAASCASRQASVESYDLYEEESSITNPNCRKVVPSSPTALTSIDAENDMIVAMTCGVSDSYSLLGSMDNRSTNYWPEGKIHYRYEKTVSSETKKLFRASASRWERGVNEYLKLWNVTGEIRFVHDVKHDQNDYILVSIGHEINASISGKGEGKQLLKLKDEETSRRTMLHEIGHVLGLSHEQSRCDRDEYVDIVYKNVIADKKDNFKKRCQYSAAYYDYSVESIMHYSSDAYSKNDKPTIVLWKDPNRTWKQSSLPQDLDYKTVARGYATHVFNVPEEFFQKTGSFE